MRNELVARLEHTPNGNIVHCFDNSLDFKQFEGLKSKCELCGTIRYRKYSYIVKMAETGKLVQVGSSCLHKLVDELSKAEELIYSGIGSYDPLLEFMHIKGTTYFQTSSYISACIHQNIDPRHPFDVLDWISKNHSKITNADREMADKVIEYYKGLETESNFMSNVKVAVIQEWNNGNFKLLNWAYKCYSDAIHYDEINSGTGLTSDTFIIKDIFVKQKYCNDRYSYYGTDQIVYRIIDENSNIIEFDTASEKDFLTWLGKKVKCTIKKQYKSYSGIVTKVTRLREAK